MNIEATDVERLYGSGGNSVALASRRLKGVFVTLPAKLTRVLRMNSI